MQAHERGPCAQKHRLCTYPSGHPTSSRHSSEPQGLEGGEHFTPSVLVEISSSLRLPFISASDSAGPGGLMSAPRWAPSKRRFMVRSAPRLCCAACAQGTRAALELTLQQRNLGISRPPSVSPQRKPHFVHSVLYPALLPPSSSPLISNLTCSITSVDRKESKEAWV